MGLFDIADTAFWGAAGLLADAKPIARAVPGLGEIISGTQAVYHAGSAVYDGVTGDRDGAIDHGAQALWNGVGAIPAVSEVMGTAELVASGVGLGARVGGEALGLDSGQIPDGFDSLFGAGAVGLTNLMFGADDSNWIADGDTPQGTRAGEVGAGMGLVGAGLGGAMGMIGGPLGMMAGQAAGGWLGNELGNWLGGPSNPLGSPAGAPTSGAQPGWLATQAAAAHDSLGGPAAGALGGAALGTAMLPGIGTIAGAIGGGLMGLADSAWNIF